MNQHIAETCSARHNCKQHKILCGTNCPFWIELKYQIELAGIPKRHQRYTLESLDKETIRLSALQRYGATLQERIDSGQGLYLFGNAGSGKTTALCALAMSYIVNKSKESMLSPAPTRQLVQYVNVPDLLVQLKQGFDDLEIAKITNHKLSVMRTVPLCIIDDIGAEKPSEWVRERLTQIIGHRYDEELCTFFSSNLTIPELGAQLDPKGRIPSRIEGSAIPVEYRGKDRRKAL